MKQDYHAKAKEWKRAQVKELKEYFSTYKTIGFINLENLPAFQLQKIRAKLRDRLQFYFPKKRLVKRVIDELKLPQSEQLKAALVGVPALVFTNESVVSLFSTFERGKSAAPARAGQLAPEDIIIPAGPTSFTPGPIIGEFGQLGIKTEVKEGKISLREEKLVVKQGQPISGKIADIITKLGMEPMRIGVTMVAGYQDSMLFTPEALSMTPERYAQFFTTAAQESIALSLAINFPTHESAPMMLQKAEREALSLEHAAHLDEKLSSTGSAPDSKPPESAPPPHSPPPSPPPPPPLPQEVKKEEPKPIPSQPLPKPEAPSMKPELKPVSTPAPPAPPVKEILAHPPQLPSPPRPPAPVQQKQHASPNMKIEGLSNYSEDTSIKAQQVLQKVQDQMLRQSGYNPDTKKKEVKSPDVPDISKLINQLKDKKSRGELR